jgi:2,3-bisphosphoglycerate-dependent phosphoglycerate mutase
MDPDADRRRTLRGVSTQIIFETHSITEDNERGVATGWLPGRLSSDGRMYALALGARRRDDGLAAVFASDLRRSVETAEIAFGSDAIPVLYDWRLRECDYGQLNGAPTLDVVGARRDRITTPYPGGENWAQALDRVERFLADVPLRWDGSRILVIGHVATRWALDRALRGRRLEDLVDEEFAWQEGWEYDLP